MDIISHQKRFMAKFERYEPKLQDHSAMIIAKNCYRKYFYRIVLGRVPYVDPNQTVLDFGSAGHKFYEVLELTYQKEGNQEIAFGTALKAALAYPIAVPNTGSKWEYLDRQRLTETLMACFKYWQEEKKRKAIEVLAVEQPLNVALPDGNFTSGRMDQLVKWNGLLWDRDFKFTSKDRDTFAKGIEPNDQATRYIYMGTKLHGAEFRGVIFQTIINLKTKKPEIASVLSERTPAQLAQWEKEQVVLNRTLNVLREEDTWPMQEHNCAWCPYANVCRRANEASQMAALEQNFKLSPWDHTKVGQEVL